MHALERGHGSMQDDGRSARVHNMTVARGVLAGVNERRSKHYGEGQQERFHG